MMGRPPLMSLLSTFSVNLILVGLGTAIWGTALFNVNVSLPGVTIDRYTFPARCPRSRCPANQNEVHRKGRQQTRRRRPTHHRVHGNPIKRHAPTKKPPIRTGGKVK